MDDKTIAEFIVIVSLVIITIFFYDLDKSRDILIKLMFKEDLDSDKDQL
jgi:hypothetical protein